MSASIFQPEISTLEAQLAALHAQIAAAQERITLLNEVESVADGALAALQGAVERVAALAPGAITTLQSRVLSLFKGDDNSDGGNGNIPLEPTPQPGDDGGIEPASDDPAPTDAQEPAAITRLKAKLNRAYPWPTSSAREAIAAEALTGQSSEWASPWASTLASPLCCLLEDAPQSVLSRQSVEIAITPDAAKETEEIAVNPEVSPEVPKPTSGTQTICSADGTPKFDLIWTRLSDRVATYSSPENPYNWEGGFVTYIGFPTKEVALAWQQHLLKLGVANKAIIRKVNRLKVDCPKGVRIRWEMKVHGLSDRQLQHILGFDLTQPPQTEQKASANDFEVCDRVRILKTSAGSSDKRIGDYGIVQHVNLGINMLEVKADSSRLGGTLLMKPEWVAKIDSTQFPVCCPLPEPEVLAALGKFHPGDRFKVVEPGHVDNGEFGTVKRLVLIDGVVAVQLDNKPIERLYPAQFLQPLKVEELVPAIADEPAEVSDTTTTDWKAQAKELSIAIDNLEPGHYRAYHGGYRKLGEVIQKWDADNNSYWVNRNQKTVLNVGNGDGQHYSDPHEAAIGLARFMKVIKDAAESKADLFGTWDEASQQQQIEANDRVEPEAPKTNNLTDLAQQEIQVRDWVELLATGNTYEVTSVDGDELHLLAGSESMVVHPWEIQLAFRVPADWQLFAVPTNPQPF